MTTIQQAIFLDGGPGQIDYWFNQLTDTNANSTTGYSLTDHAFDSLGNIVVAGTSVNNTWPDNKHFWHKIGKNGDILVTRTFSDSNSASDVTNIAIDSSDNIYAAIGNARFVKWDSSNNIVYSKQNTWSNSNQNYGDSGVGGGSLTLSGNALTYYSIGNNRRAMQVDASTGETTSATTASSGNTIFGVGGFGKTSQGNFLCGYVQSPSTNNDNYWMVATTSLSQQFCFYNGSTAAICRGIDYINGNYYIVGLRQTDNSFAGDALMYKLGSYSSSGNQGILWSRRIRNINNTSNGSYQSQFYDVAGDSEGNIYTVGHSPNPGTTQGGIIMKFDSGGTVVWSRFIQHSSGATYVTKITIDSNDTLWVNIHVGGNVCGVAKLPSNGLFIGTYCGFTVTDWSNGFNSSYQSFNHNAQSGAVPTFFSGGSSLTLGSPVTVSYTEPTVPGSSGQCKSMVASTTDPGQESFTTPGTYQWTAPAGITKVSVVAVGGGGGGQTSTQAWNAVSSCGGAGGGLGWKNNIPVTPGQSYTVVVGAGGDGLSSDGLVIIKGSLQVDGTTNTVNSTNTTLNDPIINIGDLTSKLTVLATVASGVSTVTVDSVVGINTGDTLAHASIDASGIGTVASYNPTSKVITFTGTTTAGIATATQLTATHAYDTNSDRGISFNYNTSQGVANNKSGFFGYNDSAGESSNAPERSFTYIPDASLTGSVASGTRGFLDIKGIYYQSGDWPSSGASYFDSTGKLTSTGTPASGITTSNYVLTTSATGIPVWTTTLDGGTF